MKKSCLFLFLFSTFWIVAQIQKDTTFSIQSEYKKNQKSYPAIKMVSKKTFSSIFQKLDVVYKSINNRDLHFDAFINKKTSKLPSLIILHGGGWNSGNKEMQNTMAQELASKGFQTFTIEYRLSDEAKYPAAIDDVKDAIQFIKKNAKKFKINSSKISILGCSSGGQMAALVGLLEYKDIKAIVDVDGILAFHHPESKESKAASNWLGGTYEEIPRIWEQASPLFHVQKKSPPILFINSQFERFHAGRNDMIALYDQYKIYHEVKSIENSPHAFWLFQPWFDPTINYITGFLNKIFK